MRNTFAVTMTLLLALTLGGSYAGYRLATTPHHAEEAGAAGKAREGGDPTTQKVVSEEAPSPREAASGAAGAGGALGDIMQDQAGGTLSGENGAVAAEGSESNTGTQTGEAQEGDAQDGGAGEANEANNGAANAQDTAAEGSGTGQGSTSQGSAGQNGTGQNGAGQGAGQTETTPGGTEEDGAGSDDTSTGDDTGSAGAAQGSATAAQSGGNTRLGQTGASNAEKSAAAEVASVISGNTGEGQVKFVSTCGGCHGQNAEGVVGPNLKTAEGPKGWTLAQFTAVLREHRTPERELNAVMPVYSEAQLGDQDVANIYAYIRTLN